MKRVIMRLQFLWIWLLPLLPAQAQQGDKQGEQQVLRVPREKIPPAPPLSPTKAMKSFKTAPGFRIELVASEPLIECPIALAFDPDGRLWILEMRGFMPNADSRGELEPLGRVSILEDTDHDGRMDKRTVFLDGLVQPRALALARGGALVAEPPNLWYCRDTNGDGRCDEKTLVAPDYAAQDDPKLGNKANPEHAGNGLVHDLDNWIYNLYHTYRYRFTEGRWRREESPNRTQWGLAQDDFGRLFFTSNSDPLRGDLIPLPYARKFGAGIRVPGLNVQIERDLSVWPIRVNPGVNRGYQEKQLRADGTLATFTAACGTTIYRGDAYPPEFRGDAFVCEPSGNVIRRERLFETNGIVTATNAYDRAEFLSY